jgi:hypothetical protein
LNTDATSKKEKAKIDLGLTFFSNHDAVPALVNWPFVSVFWYFTDTACAGSALGPARPRLFEHGGSYAKERDHHLIVSQKIATLFRSNFFCIHFAECHQQNERPSTKRLQARRSDSRAPTSSSQLQVHP